eukprot:456569_1
MESEKERLNGSPSINDHPHARRGAVVIQPQKSKSHEKSHFSLSITDSQNKTIYSDDEKSEESSSIHKSKHHRSSKQVISIMKLKNKSKHNISDIDEIGGGSSMHHIEVNNIINKLGGNNDTETDTDTEYDSSHVSDNNIKPTIKKKIRNDFKIDYTILQWIFVLFFTLVAVIDRFTINLWPLWVDSPGPTIPNNFTVSLFALISWISGRMMLVSSSYLFLFQNHVFWNWIVEQKWINKFIRIGDIHNENTALHYHIGWLLCGIPVLLHVWSIVFAGLSSQNSMKLYHSWMRPNDILTGKSIPFYDNNLLSLAINDIYRLVSTSVAFFILIPYSVISCCRNRNWSFAQWIHLFGASLYTIDLIRMYSHPHCWVFNCPFILWWILDRLYGIFYYRRCVANVVKKTVLDEQYIILYLRIPEKFHLKHTIGDIFYFNTLSCGWDRAHPFTVFQNHRNANKMTFINEDELDPNWAGHKFSIRNRNNQYIMKRMSTELEFDTEMDLFNNSDDLDEKLDEIQNEQQIPDSNDWNVGVIMQAKANHKHMCYERKTWTNDLANIDFRHLCGLRAWGPYRSEYRKLMKVETDVIYPVTPLVLIASGAGCSYLIDYYQYIVANKIKLENTVQFYFTARALGMFQWFTNITCNKHINNFYVNAHLTSH